MKTRIRFLFHKPIGEHGIGKVIVGLTWLYALFYSWKALKYHFSHEEAWIPDDSYCERTGINAVIHKGFVAEATGGTSYSNFHRYIGQCFSSTTRGKVNGVRFAPASEVLKHPERWDYIEVEVDAFRLEVALEEAKKLEGKKYDFLGILGFVSPLIIQDRKRWYGSEICNWFKCLCGIQKLDKRISPRRAAYLLAKKWGEPKSLA